MSLTQMQIKHIANLSRLDLTDEDLIKYSKDLNSIVDYIDKLNQINDNNLKEISLNENNILPLREDVIWNKEINTKTLLSCSKKQIINDQITIGNIMN